MCSRTRLFILFAILCVSFTPTHPARAELLTFRFAGVVTGTDANPGFGFDPNDIDLPAIGTPFTGYYKFDSIDVSFPPHRGHTTVLMENAVEVSIGELRLAGQASFVGGFIDSYQAGDWIPGIELTSHPDLAPPLDRNHFQLRVDKEGLYPDPILPLHPPSLVGVDNAFLRISLDSGINSSPIPFFRIEASLDSLVRVPEPGTVSGLATVFFLLGIRRPKRI